MSISTVALNTWSCKLGGMDPSNYKITDEQLVLRLKISFAGELLANFGFYMAKFSLLALYYQLFVVVFRKLRIALHIVSAYVISAGFTTCCLYLFRCQPIQGNWSLNPNACNVLFNVQANDVIWSLNISSDILVFILPFFLLRHLKFDREQISGLVAMFLLGAITIACSIARYTVLRTYILVNYGPIYVLYDAEMSASLIVVSIPVLRPLLHSRLSRMSSSRGNSIQSRKSLHASHASHVSTSDKPENLDAQFIKNTPQITWDHSM